MASVPPNQPPLPCASLPGLLAQLDAGGTLLPQAPAAGLLAGSVDDGAGAGGELHASVLRELARGQALAGADESLLTAAQDSALASFAQLLPGATLSVTDTASTTPQLASAASALQPMSLAPGALGLSPFGVSGVPSMAPPDLELEARLQRFLQNHPVDGRAAAALRSQPELVKRAVLDRGDLTDCVNMSAALMGRIQVAKDNVSFQQGKTLALPIGIEGTSPSAASTATVSAAKASPEVEQFIIDNSVDDMAARQLREADKMTQDEVLSRGSLEGCRNPSAVCLGRIREARLLCAQRRLTEQEPKLRGQLEKDGREEDELAAKKIIDDLSAEVDRFLLQNKVDSRAASALRSQLPAVQRAVLDRGELTDCLNVSASLMGRIQVAKDNVSSDPRGRLATLVAGAGLLGLRPPGEASLEVEKFIIDNKVDEMAARQLREADKQTQNDVLARGSLDDCRNPSAVCLARIREAKALSRPPQDPAASSSLSLYTQDVMNSAALSLMNQQMLMMNPLLLAGAQQDAATAALLANPLLLSGNSAYTAALVAAAGYGFQAPAGTALDAVSLAAAAAGQAPQAATADANAALVQLLAAAGAGADGSLQSVYGPLLSGASVGADSTARAVANPY